MFPYIFRRWIRHHFLRITPYPPEHKKICCMFPLCCPLCYFSNIQHFPFCFILHIISLMLHISVTFFDISSILIRTIRTKEPHITFSSARKRLFDSLATSKHVSSCIDLSFNISLPMAPHLGLHISCLKLVHAT